MINKVKENLIELCQVKEGEHIILGLSGGPDSVFLFHMFRELQSDIRFQYSCAHVNHLYRGEEAYKDEAFSKNLCKEYGVRFFLMRRNATEYSNEKGITEEEAGREIRYNFFNELITRVGGGYIATGHNYNDQAETLMQRIIRGTGLDGLTGMTFRNGNLIRPILNIKRQEIEAYLANYDYGYCTDQTNLETVYGRNKIRLQLIPHIEQYYNAKFSDSLYRLSQTAKLDKDLIDSIVNEEFRKNVIAENECIKVDLLYFNQLIEGLQLRLLRKGIETVKGSKSNIEFNHLKAFVLLCKREETGKSLDLPDNIRLEISYGKVIIKTKDEIKNYEYNIEVGKELVIDEIKMAIFCHIEKFNCIRNSPNTVSIDCDKIKGNLVVRNRRRGDKFQPLGMTGTKKIKDFFIDERVPREKRDTIPIIADQEDIIWIAGYRMSECYKVDTKTKNILILEIREV